MHQRVNNAGKPRLAKLLLQSFGLLSFFAKRLISYTGIFTKRKTRFLGHSSDDLENIEFGCDV